MSVLAMAEITLSFERDISSVHRFYKIAASTTTPAAWTASQTADYIANGTIVSGWSLTEPAYDNTTTNSLYFFDLTVFSDNTYNKTDISKSSSYEAAKQAYEEAVAAHDAAAAIDQHFWSDTDGAHITEVPKDDFIEDPENSGSNLLAESTGLSIRKGITKLAQFLANGITFSTEEKPNMLQLIVEEVGGLLRSVIKFGTNGRSKISGVERTVDSYIYGDFKIDVIGGRYRKDNIIQDYGITLSSRNYGNTSRAELILTPEAGVSLQYLTNSNKPGVYIGDSEIQIGGYANTDSLRLFNDHTLKIFLGSGGAIATFDENSIGFTKPLTITNSAPRIDLVSSTSAQTLRVLSNNNGNKGLYSPDFSKWLVLMDDNGVVTCGGRTMSALLQRGNFTTTQHSTSTGSISADSYVSDKTATFTKSGYYPYGIVGVNIAGTNRMHQSLYTYRLSSRSEGSATVSYSIRNRASAAFNGTIYFDILWIEVL